MTNPDNFDATAQQQDRERERVVGVECANCGGRGEVGWFDRRSGAPGWVTETCPECGGSGRIASPDLLPLAERLQLALERVGVKLTTGQVLLVASELRGEIG